LKTETHSIIANIRRPGMVCLSIEQLALLAAARRHISPGEPVQTDSTISPRRGRDTVLVAQMEETSANRRGAFLNVKALSIRQPWAYLIVAGHKDIENRTWRGHYRGRFLVHAPQSISQSGVAFAERMGITLPADLPRGGIVGSVEMVDCVQAHASPWFEGPFGFVLRDAKALPFQPCLGRLSFFTPTTVS
jgi:hypothetical protein